MHKDFNTCYGKNKSTWNLALPGESNKYSLVNLGFFHITLKGIHRDIKNLEGEGYTWEIKG